MRKRLQLYGDFAKWLALVLWWGAALVAALRVLGTRLGLPWHKIACQSPYCDFSAFWQVARMASAGQAALAYDPTEFLRQRVALLGQGGGDLFWFYPPTALLAVVGVSALTLYAAFWIWTSAVSSIAFVLLRAADIGFLVIIMGLLSPAALWALELGQFGGLTGAALVAGLVACRRLPAGLALALLVVKPQAGLLAPVALIAAGRWRTVAVAAGFSALLMVTSFVWFGAIVWRTYFGIGLQMSRSMLVILSVTPGTAQFGVSVFGMLRSFGAAVAVAGFIQGAAMVLALGGTVWVWRRGDPVRRVLCTTILALLATPYGYVDDMVGVSLALVLCIQARGWRFSLTDVLLFTWPALSPVVYTATGWQVTPVLLLLGLWRSGAGVRVETAPGSTGRAGHSRAVG
jgi:alpha-1,2-mannosyltransferase